jgi:hypothetical protein
MKIGDLVRSWVVHNEGVGIIVGLTPTHPKEVEIQWSGVNNLGKNWIPREDFEDDLKLGNMEIVNESR